MSAQNVFWVGVQLALLGVTYWFYRRGNRERALFLRALEQQQKLKAKAFGPYLLLTDASGARGITCNTCGKTSWSRGDVEHLYCAHCRRFHNDPPGMPPV